MKKMQSLLVVVALVLAGFSASLHAEDTDIYVDNSTTTGAPNVLFILDNGANFSATSSGPGCSNYAGTSEVPSLGSSTAAGVVQCALVDAINSLPDGALNIGLLVTNSNNYGRNSTSASDKAYHELCNVSGAGGCLLRRLTLMTGTSKTSMVNFIKSWNSSGNASDASNFSIKVNTALQDTAMQEAWAYYNGVVGFSGTDYGASPYSGSLVATGCQRNFIIYIANTDKTPSNGNPTPGASYDSSGRLIQNKTDYSLSDPRVVPNPDTYGWGRKITDPVTFTPAVCGTTTLPATNSTGDWSSNWADEWARVAYEQDRGTKAQQGTQNIRTYTIGITTDKCFPDTPALLSSMADKGGGKYFQTSNASQVKEALAAILNEVQAVNSVFSSASLPVSVNAQGTYLNQIFLGMFRPDSSAAPRWMGNLKQYKLVNKGGNLVMGDANGNSAINNNTGFLSPTAESIWTYKNISAYPDKDLVTADTYGTIGGFFRADKTDRLQGKGTPPSTFDLPDGEVVEKGGVAQQLRRESLNATFAGDRTTNNPRRLYTYCPSGSATCIDDLTDPMHSFVTTNADIGVTAFGSSSSVAISSIVRTGTTAVVTTTGNHGFSSGTVVTIANSTQPEYNVTQAITVTSPTTFTITGLPDWPVTPATGTYTVSLPGSTPVSVQSLTRSTNSAGTGGKEIATATTTSANSYVVGSKVLVSGVTGVGAGFYMVGATVTSTNLLANSFTYEMDVDPHAGAALNTYQVSLNRAANPAYNSVTLTNGTTAGLATGTIIGHNFHVGQTIVVSGAPNNRSAFNGTFTVKAVSGANFTLDNGANGFKTNNGTTSATVTLTPDYTPYALTLTRGTSSASAGTTVTGALTSARNNWFGPNKVVDITYVSGNNINETAYANNPTPAITCVANTNCNTFTFNVAVTPPETATGTMTVALQGPTATVNGANITRSGTTGTVSGLTAGKFTDQQTVNIAASGTQLSSEAAYAGEWKITCPPNSSCTSFTFGPIAVSPASPATGSKMQAFSGSTGPDKTSLVRWIRGENNQGDEKNPYPTLTGTSAVTVRESVHGDVLHSRPLVINYGDARGIVAYYGANDGIFRAVNGNTTGDIGSSPAVKPGGELWGLLLPEHYQYYDRLRQNTPELRFPASFSSTARYKDYFIDGPTGSYQKLNPDGTMAVAHIFLTMRRGGRFMYALDVTNPTRPRFLWKRTNTDPGFEELGQTWSRPRLTLLQGYANPVLVFGAGYDPAEDSEPPGTDTMGRGIYVVDAASGDLLWSAVNTCSGNVPANTATGVTPVCLAVPGMKYAIPSDIAFVDRSGPVAKPDGRIDKLYVGDVGGNVWRVDLSGTDMATWSVTKLAALGCESGACASGTAPRKFFFPPSVLSIKGAGVSGSYDAISIVSGDREHPLKNAAAGSAYNTVDRFFMLKDTATTYTAPTTLLNGVPYVMSNLFKITTAQPTYDQSGNGFYYTFAVGEKAVNAPLAVSGYIFFSTNKPKEPDGTCVPDLGTATAYAINPFSGAAVSNVLEGGGLPPSAVSGIVEYTTTTTNADNTTTTTTTQEKFCIGCGISGAKLGGSNTTQCSSALENCNVGKSVAKNLRRTYWYKK